MSTENKNILYGGADIPLIDTHSKSLGEIILKKFAEYGDTTVFIDGVSGVKVSASELHSKIIQLAKCLKLELGIKEGDVIGLYSENRLEFPIILYAAFCVGATVAPLNVTYTDRELNHALNLSRPKVLFATKVVCNKAIQVAAQNTFLKNVVLLDKVALKSQAFNIAFFQNLVRNIDINDCKSFESQPVNLKQNIGLILCSSGTTGLAKGVELTQFNILNAISQLNVTISMGKALLNKITILMVIPLFHAYGILSTIGSSICGAEVVILPKFEERSFLNAIQTYKTNVAFLVPPLLLFLAKSPVVDEYDVSSLMILGCGAASLSKDLQNAVQERLNIFAIRQGYGMSEMTLSVLTQTETHCKSGSVGCLRPGIWGKIIDPDTGRALGPNERGEMCFKGSSIMKGYTNDVEATRKTIDPDGWLHTGDIGYFDANEEWFIVDRIKELIKYKGFQVPPAEIEAILLTHPSILDAAVIGIPDEKAGELPLAFVVRKNNVELTERDVYNFVAKTTSPAKRLHGGVRFIDEIPKNPSGKILRRVLRDLIKNKLPSKL